MSKTFLSKNTYEVNGSYTCEVHKHIYSIVPMRLSEEESIKLFERRAAFYLQMKTPPAEVSQEDLEKVQGAYMYALLSGPRPDTRLERAHF